MNPDRPISYSRHLAIDNKKRIEQQWAPSRKQIEEDIRDNRWNTVQWRVWISWPTRKIRWKYYTYIIWLHSQVRERLLLITLYK